MSPREAFACICTFCQRFRLFDSPLDNLLEDLYNVLDFLLPVCTIFTCAKDAHGAALVIEEGTSGLEETADKEEFKKLFRVLEELESCSSEDELLYKSFYRRFRREGIEVEEKGVAES